MSYKKNINIKSNNNKKLYEQILKIIKILLLLLMY